MSIKKRLVLSNIGMIIIPVVSIVIFEIFIGYLLFVVFKGNPQSENLDLFISLRFIGMLLILIITNGLLTYFVSKSIINPIKKLMNATKKISEGDLDFSVASDKKDELGELSNTFEKMRLDLKEAQADQLRYEKSRKELIASISHDLKTPLTSIKGYVKGIQDGVANTPEKVERYIRTIDHKANDMDVLLDEFFLYSKLDLERIPFKFEDMDLYSFFNDFIDELRFDIQMDQGSANLFANEEESYIVKADREQIKRVVTNIVQNSFKYMDKESQHLQVRLKSDLDQVFVKIKDNGSGISKEDLPFIFTSFYRTDSSRNSETGGSGLGLSIAKKIVNGHGGTIWAHSQLGEGTSINFTLKKVLNCKES
ncbi:sensor histidine kinase [Aureibacillus halotolerans]|uniref:histidine kinase n=1 Tax=Aureibacillus halotolerans TaxID=1508390 RepID=A0A4R6U4H9_9BACI|nr:HAMP domain-containing sensor histidine kinase [Aureibacillus halotolerans]TDQ41051.1 phospho-acceptor domain-containing protein [Aureibacillus halotolerans]